MIRGSAGVVLFLFAFLSWSLAPALAHAQSQPLQPSVSGSYDSAGFHIEFPTGWNGTTLAGGKYPIVSPGTHAGASMSVVMVNRLEVKNLMITSETGIPPEPGGKGYEGGQCPRTLAELAPVNGINVFHTVTECGNGNEKKNGMTDSYVFFTLTKSIAVVYSADSKGAYDRYLPDFENSLKTAKVDEPVNIRSALEIVLGITKFYDKSIGIPAAAATAAANANDGVGDNNSGKKRVDMVIGASSNNVSVAFDEPGRRFVIKVNEVEGQGGRLLVPVDEALRGPYQVHVDGALVPDPLVIEDSSTNERLVLVEYGKGARQIVITGAQVVPEFPLHVEGMAFAAAILLSSILLSRHRPCSSRNNNNAGNRVRRPFLPFLHRFINTN